jgi:hypothetical protein
VNVNHKGSLVKKELISHPDEYFALKKQALDDAINAVSLPPEKTDEIKAEHAGRLVRDKLLGLFKLGEIVNAILTWNHDVDEYIREAKKEYLLADYFEKTEDIDNALSKLQKFLTSPRGNTLFNKMLRIFDDSPPDGELANHLAAALRHIVMSDFEAMFEQHRYALAQIDKLTPQTLTILADHHSWPQIPLSGYAATGTKVTSDWLSEFTKVYADVKRISNPSTVERIRHSINELIAGKYIEAHLIGGNKARCVATQVGQLLLPYILA